MIYLYSRTVYCYGLFFMHVNSVSLKLLSEMIQTLVTQHMITVMLQKNNVRILYFHFKLPHCLKFIRPTLYPNLFHSCQFLQSSVFTPTWYMLGLHRMEWNYWNETQQFLNHQAVPSRRWRKVTTRSKWNCKMLLVAQIILGNLIHYYYVKQQLFPLRNTHYLFIILLNVHITCKIESFI